MFLKLKKLLKPDQSLKSYSQKIINIFKLNLDCSPHAANKLFSLTRHQAARGRLVGAVSQVEL